MAFHKCTAILGNVERHIVIPSNTVEAGDRDGHRDIFIIQKALCLYVRVCVACVVAHVYVRFH